jgi:polyphosphate kinase
MPSRKQPARQKAAYFNRELSWLAFNRRVLEQAEDAENPLLERLKYLSFVSSNLDEFFEIRVAGLIQQVEANISKAGIDGLGPRNNCGASTQFLPHLSRTSTAAGNNRLFPGWPRKGFPLNPASS